MSLSNNSISIATVHPGIGLPKVGTLIPNRIFVGGIGSNTSEDELRAFFSVFGPIKDVKIIYDKSGLAKGSYGFVTFEDQHTAESIIKNEAESLIFKDRKLNIGYAVRKQHIFQKHELGGTLLLAHNSCSFTNGLSVVQLCPHDHSVIAMGHQPTLCYPTTLMLPTNHSLSTSTTTMTNNPSTLPQNMLNHHAINNNQLLSSACNYPQPNDPSYSSTVVPGTFMPSSPKQMDPGNRGGGPLINPSVFHHPPRTSHHPILVKTLPTTPPQGLNRCQWFTGVPQLSAACHLLPGCEAGQSMLTATPANSFRFHESNVDPRQIKAVLSGEMGTCRCRTGFDMTLNEREGKVHQCVQNEPMANLYPSAIRDEPCCPQCVYRSQRHPHNHFIPACTTVMNSEKHNYPTSTTTTYVTTNATDHNPTNFIQRIMQSHSCEHKSPEALKSCSVTSYRPDLGDHLHELQDQLLDATHSQGESSVSRPIHSSIWSNAGENPEATASNPSMVATSQTTSSSCFISPINMISDVCTNPDERPNRNLFPILQKTYPDHPSGPSHVDTSVWSDPFGASSPFTSKRLFGVDVPAQYLAEPKVSTPVLSPNNLTSAYGDISKQRQE